jgi:hypothetical protein
MKQAYYRWAPPHGIRVYDVPPLTPDWKYWILTSKAVCGCLFRELMKIDWGLWEDLPEERRPFRELDRIDLYPDEIFEAVPGLWILSTRTPMAPAVIARDALELRELRDQEVEKGGPSYYYFEIPEALALKIVSWDDDAEREEGYEASRIHSEAAEILRREEGISLTPSHNPASLPDHLSPRRPADNGLLGDDLTTLDGPSEGVFLLDHLPRSAVPRLVQFEFYGAEPPYDLTTISVSEFTVWPLDRLSRLFADDPNESRVGDRAAVQLTGSVWLFRARLDPQCALRVRDPTVRDTAAYRARIAAKIGILAAEYLLKFLGQLYDDFGRERFAKFLDEALESREAYWEVSPRFASQLLLADDKDLPEDLIQYGAAAARPTGGSDLNSAPPDQAPGPPEGEPAPADGQATLPSETKAAGPVVSRKPEGHDGKKTGTRIKEELDRDPLATSEEIAARIGRRHQTVRRHKAWQQHPARLAQQVRKTTDALDRPVPLTHEMMALIDSRTANPAEIVAEQEEQDVPEAVEPIEVVRARFLNVATAGQRARFNRLSPEEKEIELRAWNLTGEFLPDEPPIADGLRGHIQRRAARQTE